MGCPRENEGEWRDMKTGLAWMAVRLGPSVSKESRMRGWSQKVFECQAEGTGSCLLGSVEELEVFIWFSGLVKLWFQRINLED